MTKSQLLELLENAVKKLRKEPVDDARFKGDTDDEVNDGVLAGLQSYFGAPNSPHVDPEICAALTAYNGAWCEEEVNKPG